MALTTSAFDRAWPKALVKESAGEAGCKRNLENRRPKLTERKDGELATQQDNPEEGEGIQDLDWAALSPGVNDTSALLEQKFVPTRYELKVIAEHYLREREFWEHWKESIGKDLGMSEIRFLAFADLRLDMIWELLPGKDIDDVVRPMRGAWHPKFTELWRDLVTWARPDCGSKPPDGLEADDAMRADGL